MKGKNIIVLFIGFIVMLSSFSGCDRTVPENKIDIADTQEKYKIYIGSGLDSISDKRKENKENEKYSLEIDDVDSFKLGFGNVDLTDNDNAEKEISIVFNNRSYLLPYTQTHKNAVADCDNSDLSRHGIVNRYSNEYIICDIRQDSGKISFFSDLSPDIALADGTMTDDEAIAAAAAFCNDYFTSEVMSDYTFEISSYTEGMVSKCYTVMYRRYIHGYKTDETITIGVNLKGDIMSVNAMKMNSFDGANEFISAEAVSNAENAIESYLPGSILTVRNLTVGSDGKYYLVASCSIDGEILDAYISIN